MADVLMGRLQTVTRFFLVALFVVTVSVVACDPRETPGFKRLAKQQEERITRKTEEAIKGSPKLQDLDRLCTKEIPRPEDFVPINKYKDLHGERFLGYGYHSKADFERVKNFYVKYFADHGWSLTRETIDGWGPSEIEFRNQQHKVIISDVVRGDRINYFLHCERLESSPEEVPRSTIFQSKQTTLT
jgi:hypothetical protein